MKYLGLVLGFFLVAPFAEAQPAACRSWQGLEVPYLGDPALEGIGGATRNNRGRAVILLNPEKLAAFPPLARDFWLAHECGHLALTPHYNTEAEADCFAMRRLRKKLVRSDDDLRALQQALDGLPKDAWPGHRPDAERISALSTCEAG